jgi:hypothetical protein
MIRSWSKRRGQLASASNDIHSSIHNELAAKVPWLRVPGIARTNSAVRPVIAFNGWNNQRTGSYLNVTKSLSSGASKLGGASPSRR